MNDKEFEISLARAYFDGALSAVLQLFDREQMTAIKALQAIRCAQQKLDAEVRAIHAK